VDRAATVIPIQNSKFKLKKPDFTKVSGLGIIDEF
jgi:hypothetical protein